MKKKFLAVAAAALIATLTLAACGHVHTYSETEWLHNEEGHWHPATCEHTDERGGYAAHKFVPSQENGGIGECECGYSELLVSSLAAPANLAFASHTLTFGAVQYAEAYTVTLTRGDQVAYTEEIAGTSLDLAGKGLVGEYTASVSAKLRTLSSAPATVAVDMPYVDTDVLLEAEDAIIASETRHLSIDMEYAHGGAYAQMIDNSGEGLYFRYFAFEEGEREVDVEYGTHYAGSYMNLYCNSVFAAKVEYPEWTDWIGDFGITATTTVTVNFQKGWNELYLIKDGTRDDELSYGGWAQIDYIVIRGTGKEYDPADVDMTATTYKLEAEVCEWHWQVTSRRPAKWGAPFSLGHGLGSMDAEGDGVKFRVKVTESGTYKVQLAAGGPADLEEVLINVRVNEGGPETKSFKLGKGYNDIALDEGFTVTLTAGVWSSIDFMRLSPDTHPNMWFTPDYLLLTKL